MPTLHLWRWRLLSETTGKVYTSRHHMTERDAWEKDLAAEKAPGSYERRELPDAPVMYSTTFRGQMKD